MPFMRTRIVIGDESLKDIEDEINNLESEEESAFLSKGWRLASYGGGMLNIRDWTLEVTREGERTKTIVISRARIVPEWDFLARDGSNEDPTFVGRVLPENNRRSSE